MDKARISQIRLAEDFDSWKRCSEQLETTQLISSNLVSLVYRYGTTVLTIHCLKILSPQVRENNIDDIQKENERLTEHRIALAVVDACAVLIVSTRFFDASLNCLLLALANPSDIDIRRAASLAIANASSVALDGQGALSQKQLLRKAHNSITEIARKTGTIPLTSRPPGFGISKNLTATPHAAYGDLSARADRAPRRRRRRRPRPHRRPRHPRRARHLRSRPQPPPFPPAPPDTERNLCSPRHRPSRAWPPRSAAAFSPQQTFPSLPLCSVLML